MDLENIIVEMYRRGMIKFGRFILSSGKESPYYIDLRILPSFPDLYRNIMEYMVKLASRIDYDVIAGIETSGIVHAAYLGCLLNKPIAYIRKKPKGHGTRSLVEGLINGRRILLIDDVVTTGNTLVKAVKSIRDNGGIIEDAIVIIDRCEGASKRLADYGVRLQYILSSDLIIDTLLKQGVIDEETYMRVKMYMEVSRG